VGTSGYTYVDEVSFEDGEVIFEVGSTREEGSTGFLANYAPVVSVDIDDAASMRARDIPNVTAVNDLAENVVAEWPKDTPIRFAWLDGHDWPYAHHPPSDWEGQRQQYLARGQEYSMEASAQSHLTIVQHLAQHIPPDGVIAFDDTWEVPDGFDGKGKTAVPWLLEHGFRLVDIGDIYYGRAILRKTL